MSTPSGTSRRRLLTAGGAGLAAGLLGAVTSCSSDPERGAAGDDAAPAPDFIDPHGPHQAGVHRPETPPTHLNFLVLGASSEALTRARVRRTLAELGVTVTALTGHAPRDQRLDADPVGLTIQIGIGARLLALSGAETSLDLPTFAGSAALPDRLRGGDLVLSVASEHPETAARVTDLIIAQVTAAGYRPQWSQIAFRPRGEGSITRNPLGFDDGIVQPALTQTVPEHVFLTDGATRGGSIAVVRRFILDTAAFDGLDTSAQEAVFGRVKATGAPLSGGSRSTAVNLASKTPAGEYLIPIGSHVRAAHPSFTGSTLMLRRSYGFRESRDGHLDRSGLLFISYQDDVGVFARTQLRMDREDRLMDFAEPTAEVAFLVLPGFDTDHPLGSALFG